MLISIKLKRLWNLWLPWYASDIRKEQDWFLLGQTHWPWKHRQAVPNQNQRQVRKATLDHAVIRRVAAEQGPALVMLTALSTGPTANDNGFSNSSPVHCIMKLLTPLHSQSTLLVWAAQFLTVAQRRNDALFSDLVSSLRVCFLLSRQMQSATDAVHFQERHLPWPFSWAFQASPFLLLLYIALCPELFKIYKVSSLYITAISTSPTANDNGEETLSLVDFGLRVCFCLQLEEP